jgi:hypothetical protein
VDGGNGSSQCNDHTHPCGPVVLCGETQPELQYDSHAAEVNQTEHCCPSAIAGVASSYVAALASSTDSAITAPEETQQ